jgi:hypothetical protein
MAAANAATLLLVAPKTPGDDYGVGHSQHHCQNHYHDLRQCVSGRSI